MKRNYYPMSRRDYKLYSFESFTQADLIRRMYPRFPKLALQFRKNDNSWSWFTESLKNGVSVIYSVNFLLYILSNCMVLRYLYKTFYPLTKGKHEEKSMLRKMIYCLRRTDK